MRTRGKSVLRLWVGAELLACETCVRLLQARTRTLAYQSLTAEGRAGFRTAMAELQDRRDALRAVLDPALARPRLVPA